MSEQKTTTTTSTYNSTRSSTTGRAQKPVVRRKTTIFRTLSVGVEAFQRDRHCMKDICDKENEKRDLQRAYSAPVGFYLKNTHSSYLKREFSKSVVHACGITDKEEAKKVEEKINNELKDTKEETIFQSILDLIASFFWLCFKLLVLFSPFIFLVFYYQDEMVTLVENSLTWFNDNAATGVFFFCFFFYFLYFFLNTPQKKKKKKTKKKKQKKKPKKTPKKSQKTKNKQTKKPKKKTTK